MKLKIFALCAISIILISCVGSSSMKIIFEPPKIESYCIPEINSINEVYMGETLLREGEKTNQRKITLLNEYGKKGYRDYHNSGVYDRVGYADNYILYQGKVQHWDGINHFYSRLYEDEENNVYLSVEKEIQLLSKSAYLKKDFNDETSDNFEQLFIYTGSSGDIVKFSYREFYNNMARSSFTMEATYDLSKDNIIRFKGASFEILDVGNQSIKYKLLSGFKTQSYDID